MTFLHRSLAMVRSFLAFVLVFFVANVLSSPRGDASSFLLMRSETTVPRYGGLFFNGPLAVQTLSAELNHRSQTPFAGERLKLGLDVSALASVGDGYKFLQGGVLRSREVADSVRYQHTIVPYEVHLQGELNPGFSVVLGKKRVVWGSGFGANPTDLLNAKKQAFDPGAQRRGAYLASVDVTGAEHTLSLVAAADVEENAWGVPREFVRSRAASGAQERHHLWALRYYRLLGRADINVLLYRTHLFSDGLENAWRPGLSVSLMSSDVWEWHGEFLLQKGSGRTYVTPACVARGAVSLLSCGQSRIPVTSFAQADAATPRFRFLGGSRYTFANDALLNVEYLFQGDGFSQQEFRNFVSLGAALKALPSSPAGAGSGTPASDGLLRRHYVLASLQNMKITDDLLAAINGFWGLADASGTALAQLSWSSRQDLVWTGGVLVPWAIEERGERVGALKHRVSEAECSPFKLRFSADFKFYF